MNNVSELKFTGRGQEELLPDFAADFPYTASCAQLDRYAGRFVPWHWHKAAELFYMKSGALEYHTPNRNIVIPAGAGGFVNSNVLHMTRTISRKEPNIQLLHIFDPVLISGQQGSRIEQRYVLPVTASPQIEIVSLHPGIPAQAEILNLIMDAFCLDDGIGYEIRIRDALSNIWMKLYELIAPQQDARTKPDKNDERLKTMMIYVHEHYGERITIAELASTVYLGERECFRLFHDYLHTTPAEYIRSYRLQKACQMLADSQASITDIGRLCGLGSSSYFGKVFREYAKCTPTEYRKQRIGSLGESDGGASAAHP